MSDDQGTGPSEPAELERQLARVEAERNDLRQRLDTLEARPGRRHRLRRIVTPVLVVLTVVVFTVTVPAAWGARTVLDTDRYVATVAPLADDPAVQARIASRVTDQVFEALQVQEFLAEALSEIGDRAALLAAPLTNAMKGFVRDRVQQLVASDAFASFWAQANRYVHAHVLAILRGESETVGVVEGKVLLNLLPLVNLALGSIQGVASDLVGRDVTLPEIGPDDVPSAAIAKLEQALGIDLPADYGQVVVYDSEDLAALQQALYLFERGLVALLLLIPILAGLALWASVRRRRTLIQLTAGAAIGLVIVRRLAIVLRDDLFARVDTTDLPSVRVLTNQLMDSLFRYTGVLLAIVLLVLLIALVTGPYPWAIALRGWVRDAGRAVGSVFGGQAPPETGRMRWLREHRDAVLLAVAALGAVVLFVADLSFWGLMLLAALFGLVELGLFRLGRRPIDAPAG